MAPDLNSLPPSRSPSGTPLQSQRPAGSLSPRSSSLSLAASATINAGIQNEDSRRSSTSSTRNRSSATLGRRERRRSNVAMNLNLNDPSLPGPGELQAGEPRPSVGYHFRASSPHSIGGSPILPHHHQRAPSLGELHQELEAEQEAQVNRLLEMIRQQQAQLQLMQQQAGHSTAVVDDSTPTSERSLSFPNVPSSHSVSITNPRTRSPAPRSTSFDLSHQSYRSRTSSRTGSPALRPLSAGLQSHGEEWQLSGSGNPGTRDEIAFYQAETQTLTRENQMLRNRIRELERQLNESNSTVANTPATPSNLTAPPLGADASGIQLVFKGVTRLKVALAEEQTLYDLEQSISCALFKPPLIASPSISKKRPISGPPSSTQDGMNSSSSSVKLPGSSIVGTKRSAPSLLPAFEPSSSSPSLPRPTKRSRVSSLDDDNGNFPKSDIATSSTYIPSSSPPQLPNTRPSRPVSSFSERAPLSAVPSIELDKSGDPTLMGRSSNSSHYQLSTNRLISRVHVRATYKPADHPAPRKIVVECLGWNGVKIHCQGKAWELRKGDSFTSETEDAGIIVDVQDARVLLLWPRHANAISTPTDSDSAWEDENSPRRHRTVGNRGSPFRSPLRQQHRLQSPVSPSPAVQASNSLLFNPPLPAPIQVYEDESPVDEGLTGDVITGEATQSTQHASQRQGMSPREPHSSPLSEPTGFSDADEENEPIVHSFGPFGLNLGARLESFTTNSPERRRPLQPIKEASASPQQRSSSESIRDDAANPVINHVINQLAYSRVSSTPLSALMEHLPTHLKSVSPGSKENGDLTLEALKKMLDGTRCIGEVSREGKDASGKPLENEYYYIPDLDTEEKRKEAVVDGLRKPGLRACRKQHKQYYWRKPKTP